MVDFTKEPLHRKQSILDQLEGLSGKRQGSEVYFNYFERLPFDAAEYFDRKAELYYMNLIPPDKRKIVYVQAEDDLFAVYADSLNQQYTLLLYKGVFWVLRMRLVQTSRVFYAIAYGPQNIYDAIRSDWQQGERFLRGQALSTVSLRNLGTRSSCLNECVHMVGDSFFLVTSHYKTKLELPEVLHNFPECSAQKYIITKNPRTQLMLREDHAFIAVKASDTIYRFLPLEVNSAKRLLLLEK